MRYSAGRYIFTESSSGSPFRRFVEYLQGVTLARQSINRLKPRVLEQIEGDIVEIGGYENYFKDRYKKGRYLNLDRNPGEGVVDIVGDAEELSSLVAENSLGGVFCISVIEHTGNPGKIINEIHRVIKPGGIAFVSSPWLFESHMEPQDYFRFSRDQSEIFFRSFEIASVDYTNSYFGLIAHVMQYNIFLRLLLGWIFFLLDLPCRNDPRWATQISYTLRKKDSGATVG
jgi:SAM-dependent methyltransferase